MVLDWFSELTYDVSLLMWKILKEQENSSVSVSKSQGKALKQGLSSYAQNN
jgi:hypothetical protein